MLRIISLVLACLAYTSCGRFQAHGTKQWQQSRSHRKHQNLGRGSSAGKIEGPGQLNTLADLFFAFNPAVGWQTAGRGKFSELILHPHSFVQHSRATPLARLKRIDMQLKVGTQSPVLSTIVKDKRGALDLLDEDAMHKAANFNLNPQECIEKAQAFIASNYGQGDVSLLADGFEFIGPFVGPLDRQSYVEAMEGALNPQDGFPDLCGRQFGFTVDPVEPGRVWWFTRPTGTFQKDWFGATADGSRIETAPQSMGVLLNGKGQVTKFNMGTPIDRTSGNSGGLGGLFAFMYFVGKPLPIPECQPYEQSLPFKFINKIGEFLTTLQRSRK